MKVASSSRTATPGGDHRAAEQQHAQPAVEEPASRSHRRGRVCNAPPAAGAAHAGSPTHRNTSSTAGLFEVDNLRPRAERGVPLAPAGGREPVSSVPEVQTSPEGVVRHDWTLAEVRAIHDLPLLELVHRAQTVHRALFGEQQGAALLAALDQDRRLPGGLRLLPAGGALQHRREGRAADGGRRGARRPRSRRASAGATRFCMGAAWREVKDGPQFDRVLEMVRGVRGAGHGGLLHARHAHRRARRSGSRRPGCTAYNHNLDTSRRVLRRHHHHPHLRRPAATRSQRVRDAGISVCCGGIIGMGESVDDRCGCCCTLRQPGAAPGVGADQRAGAR